MNIGVLGGTFDPVHRGHLLVAEEVRNRLELSEVIFVPAGRPQLRDNSPVAPAEHRVQMVSLALDRQPHLTLSTVEMDRPGPSYTVDTMAEFQERLGPGDQLFFILGQDILADLPQWHDPVRLIQLCRLVAVPRPGYSIPDLEKMEAEVPVVSQRVVIMDQPEIDISASDIRERVARGLPFRHMVPEVVYHYIRQHRLYLPAGGAE